MDGITKHIIVPSYLTLPLVRVIVKPPESPRHGRIATSDNQSDSTSVFESPLPTHIRDKVSLE